MQLPKDQLTLACTHPTAGVEGPFSTTVVVAVASADANGNTVSGFASCNAGVGTAGGWIVVGDGMIDRTTGVKGDDSMKGAFVGAVFLSLLLSSRMATLLLPLPVRAVAG